MAPNGLFVDFYGPAIGRRHDVYVLRKSALLARLSAALVTRDETYYIYGNPAYVLRSTLQVGYKGTSLTDAQQQFNAAMSGVRVSVEWGFAEVVRYWPFVDVKNALQIGMSPVGTYYMVAVLLTNFKNCVEPNQISQFFQMLPPSLQEYLHFA